jgi:hypothetical protein
MAGTLALVTAVIFAALCLYRALAPRPRPVRGVQIAAALLAGVFGIAWWQATGDTRWLVGGVLMLGGGAAGWAGVRRGVLIAALVLGLLGLALFAIATNQPMPVPR